jgi:hypothetical protein
MRDLRWPEHGAAPMPIPRWYVALWRAATFATTLVAGYLVAHVIVLGRFFDWLVANGRADVLRDAYVAFRSEGNPVTPYLGSFLVQAALALALVVATWILRRRGALRRSLRRLAALPVMIMVFTATGFETVEQGVMSGLDLSTPTLSARLRLNVPLHVISALVFVAAAGWLTRKAPSVSV